jgi:dihydrolipoamide dehydrogenase
MDKYDLVIIGAGPAGYVAAIRASQLGLKTAIVEKRWLGGVCLNVGCIPSKALLRNAEIAQILRRGSKDFGFSFDNLKLDYPSAVARSRQVSDRLVKGVGFLMKKNNISVIMGTARIIPGNSKSTKVVSVVEAEGKLIELMTTNVIIASGASALVPSSWKVDGKRVLTYHEAIMQKELPKQAVIIGAGAIGMEFATIWSSYGAEVIVVEMLPQILPLEDSEAASEVAKAFNKRSVRLLAGHKVEAVELGEKGVEVTCRSGDTSLTLEGEQVLVAMGFRPNSKGIGLEEAGVELNDHGFIDINDKMATNVPGIWAIGDVTGKLMLAHVGSAMGIICAENIAGHETITLDYEMMPRATYCQPQVASFGLTETQARERGYSVKIGRFPFQANGKALGLGDYAGWVKMVVDEKYGEILGATMVGPEVTELLPELTLAHMLELTPMDIARNVHAHPTLSEALMEAAHVAEGSPIHI